MASVPTPWPTWDILEHLVDKSSGYFIYAATIIKFIDDRDFRPTVRLAAVVKNLTTKHSTPFHALDELYSQILRDVPFQSHLLDILCLILHGSMFQVSTKNIERLLGLNPGDVKLTLRRLQSLLLVPQDEIDVISLHHKSFHDFLVDPNRSGKFHIGLKQRKDLARFILRALSHLPANMAHPSWNHVGWEIGALGLEYITSMIPPSTELISLIQTINFDFLWRNPSGLRTQAKKMIYWLKKCLPPPEDLITLWEGYCFVIDYNSILDWSRPITARLPDATCHAIISQFPGLLRIFQAWWVYLTVCSDLMAQSPSLLYLLFVLPIPWDERAAIVCAFRSLLNDESRTKKIHALLNFTLRSTKICREVYPWPTTCRDLARGCIRLQNDFMPKVPEYCNYYVRYWARLARLTPPCSDLLADIRDFSPSFRPFEMSYLFEIHDVLQWLKGLPQPPLDTIKCWQGYQKMIGNISLQYSDELEEPWIECRKRILATLEEH
ncbi:hypothetical protein FB451DRAFT_181078 [Mycena latifolia]|nr:hypothetical protein FB451DRAFT_181078 [Mycena latifolia]